jgi:hypothetical protein
MTTSVHNPSRIAPSLAIPGPRPLPIVGRTANVFRYISDPLGYTHQLFQRYGAVVSLAALSATMRLVGPAKGMCSNTRHPLSWSHPPTSSSL